MDSDELSRRVWRSVFVACLCATGALAAHFTLESAAGWSAAAGAALVFGSSSLPAKHPRSEALGTVGFQIFVTVGNAVTSFSLAAAGALGAGTRVGLVLDATPFYAESGGPPRSGRENHAALCRSTRTGNAGK